MTPDGVISPLPRGESNVSDPLAILVCALAMGPSLGAADVSALLVRKFGPSEPRLEGALAEYAAAPEAYRNATVNLLRTVGADRDQAVLDRATEVVKRAEAAQPGVSGPVIGRIQAQGGRVVVIRGNQAGTIYVGDVHVTEDATHDVNGLPCPYLGLESFTYSTHDRYAGREQQVAEALRQLTSPGEEQAVLFVTGASGSGKSSFALAGLVPALKERYAAEHRSADTATFRPGRRPLAALARALVVLGMPEPADGDDPVALIRALTAFNGFVTAHTAADHTNVLVVDQFEEAFTQSDPAERDPFFAILTGLAPFRRLRTHVIVTLRADYLPALFETGDLFRIAMAQRVDLRAMTPPELRRAITRPLEWQNLELGTNKRWQGALVDRLVQDTDGQSTLLPLLQVTQESIWSSGRLTLDRYDTLTDALEAKAEAVYARRGTRDGGERPEPERQALMGLLLDLVSVSLDGDPHRDVRRSVPKSDVVHGDPQRARLVDELVDARLLSACLQAVGNREVEVVDLIHETLLHNWNRLRQAVQTQRLRLQRRERFRLAVEEWREHAQSDDYLLQGVRLAEAQGLSDERDIAVQSPEGRALLDRSKQRQSRARRRRDLLIVAVSSFVVALVVVAIVAWVGFIYAGNEASRQAQVALSRLLATQALSRTDRTDLALLLAVQAYHTQNNLETRGALLTALQASPPLITVLWSGSENRTSVAFGQDGTRLFSAGQSGTVLWDLTDPHMPRPLGQPPNGRMDSAAILAFSRDHRMLAAAHADGTIQLWESPNPRSAPPSGQFVADPSGHVMAMALDPTGTTLAVAGYPIVSLWGVTDPRSTRPLAQIQLADQTVRTWSMAFSADGRTLALAGSGHMRLWDVSDPGRPASLGEPLTDPTVGASAIALSPANMLLAAARSSGSVQLWDLSTDPRSPAPIGQPMTGHLSSRAGIAAVYQLAFSPDGRMLASAGGDKTVRLWDVTDPQAAVPVGQPLTGHTGVVQSIAFSPDGKTLASAGRDKGVRLWDVTEERAPWSLTQSLGGRTSPVRGVAFSSDDTMLAAATADGTIQLWDLSSRRSATPIGPLASQSAGVSGVTFSPTSKLLASGGSDRTVRLWDLSNPQSPVPVGQPLTDQIGGRSTIAFSPNGRLLASSGTDRSVRLWDLTIPRSPEPLGVGLPGPNSNIQSLAFSGDGNMLAGSMISNGTVWLWDVANPRTPRLLAQRQIGYIESVALSPDSKTLALSVAPEMVQLWDVSDPRTPNLLGEPITAHKGQVLNLAFGPDSKTLASAGDDKIVRLWDVSDPRRPTPLGQPLTAHAGPVNGVAFSRNGTLLASASDDGTVQLWQMTPDAWVEGACRIANRNFMQAEWDQFVGHDMPYRRTCRELSPGDGAPASAL